MSEVTLLLLSVTDMSWKKAVFSCTSFSKKPNIKVKFWLPLFGIFFIGSYFLPFQEEYSGINLHIINVQNKRKTDSKEITHNYSLETVTLNDLLIRTDCKDEKVFNNHDLNTNIKQFLSEEDILERTRDCDLYFSSINQFMKNVSLEENDFPLAFSHTGKNTSRVLWQLFNFFFARNGTKEIYSFVTGASKS